MNDFSVKAIDRQLLDQLDLDRVIAFTYAEASARRFSGMLDLAVFTDENFTFYFDNYLDSSLTLHDYAKVFLPLMRSAKLENHLKRMQSDYADTRLTSFDGLNFSLGAFSHNWAHYLIGEGRHLFINRKQDIYIEELAAAISENIAQVNIVPTIKTQLGYIAEYWPQAIADIFELATGKYTKPNQTEQRHLTAKRLQFIYADPTGLKVINESNRNYRAYEVTPELLSPSAHQLLDASAVDNQSALVGTARIELDYFFHSEYFHFINPDWIHISLGAGRLILIRREYFDQAMRLCGYYRRQNLYEAIVDGKILRDNNLQHLFDYYWRICALRLAPNSPPYVKTFQDHLDQLPLTQHAYNVAQLESTMNQKIDLRKIVDFLNLVHTYFEDIPNLPEIRQTYLRRDIILAASLLSQLPQHKITEIRDIYGPETSQLVATIRHFKHAKPESLSLSESLILTADLLRKLKDDFQNLDITDFYRKTILKNYLEQIEFIISDRETLPYAATGEYAKHNALWFSQLQILRMRLDYLLDN